MRRQAWLSAALAAPLACAPAWAQGASENAVAHAQDAFGGAIGHETVGIYTETDVRGFNPQKAGNTRIDEIYFDQIATVPHRVRRAFAIRVGLSAFSDPSPAPSGILAYGSREAGNVFEASSSLNYTQYGGAILDLDVLAPILDDRLSLGIGLGTARPHFPDGSHAKNTALGLLPNVRVGGVQVKPILSAFESHAQTRPLITTNGPFLPPLITARRYLGQSWAENRNMNYTNGVLARAQVTADLLVRGGFMQSRIDRSRNFTEVFAVRDETGLSRHRLLADPKQSAYSNSWELFVAYRFGGGALRHTLHGDIRGRHRHVDSGGSQLFDFGDVTLGDPDPQPKADFAFGPVNVGVLDQSNYSLGYRGAFKGLGQVNLGITRSIYAAEVRTPAGPSRSSARPWLYNASLIARPAPDLTLFAGYVSGLEDTGQAPENALNRNQQLPASRTSQVEAGLQKSVGPLRLVATAFEMKKPYFSFDGAGRFVELGDLSHRGVELSLTGQATSRLNLVAGAILMDPKVGGEARDLGLVGPRPVGTPRAHARLDAIYRTDLLGGVSLTLSLFHDSKRAASTAGYARLGGRQLFAPARTTVDLGARHSFRVGETPMSVRFVVNNVFNDRAWKVIASNTFQMDDVRRVNLYLTADF